MRRGGGWDGSRQSAGFDLVLGNRLRQERELAGASRDALARVAGVSEQKLAEYERGEKVRALIRTSTGTTLGTRYDRVLIPWRDRSDDLIMGISIQRDVPVVI
ncbi:MAG TPA: helix-turn-helix transcriptional regulator [Stellaceae bacterium]